MAQALHLAAILLWVSFVPGPAAAQSSSNPWATPVNLSHSGAATSPAIVIDSQQTIHVLWTDQFAGYVYTKFEANAWSRPVAVALDQVFGAPQPEVTGAGATAANPPAKSTLSPDSGPRFFASSNYILGFWISGRGLLYGSRVPRGEFGNALAWETPVVLSGSVVGADVVTDDEGQAYLAYVQTGASADLPAGVYFRSSRDSGQNWSAAAPLYQSPYFRALTGEQADLQIAYAASGRSTLVYAVWDNRPRKQVLFAKSADGGRTWTEAAVIDGPAPGSGAATPFGIRLGPAGDNVLLTWQSGQPGLSCTQYYQSSADQGNTWGDRRAVPQALASCPEQNQIMSADGNRLFLISTIYGQPYLLAWNGGQWSAARPQPELFSFEDPATFSRIEFGCHQMATSERRLYVVGCDKAGGGDIWLMSRSLDEVADLSSASAKWSTPETIATASGAISSPVLVAGSGVRMHALWSQSDQDGGAVAQTALFYAGWDGAKWSRAVPVLRSPGGNAFEPAMAVDARGELVAAWSGDQPQAIYFAWANASRAYYAAEWSAPIAVPIPRDGAASPTIMIDANGAVSVAYVLPVNEGRGIYITQSVDRGRTWAEPSQVFDGAAAGWEMVGKPQLTAAGNGTLLLHWSRASLAQATNAAGVYMARSVDGGKSWSQAEAVVDAPVSWWQVTQAAEGNVYRAWSEYRSGGEELVHQWSADGGLSWSAPSSDFIETNSQAALSMAAAGVGQPALVSISTNDRGRWMLEQWNWERANWQDSSQLDVAQPVGMNVNALATAGTIDGELSTLFVVHSTAAQANQAQDRLIFVRRLDRVATAPAAETPAVSTAAVTPIEPSTEPTVAEAPQITPTPDLTGLAQAARPTSTTTLSIVVVGVVAGSLMAAGAFGLYKVYLWASQRQ